MNENMESRFALSTKWFAVLICIGTASLINSLISLLPFVPGSVSTWISRGIAAAMIVCMFRMVPLTARYQKAGIYSAVMLGCSLITAYLVSSSLITLAGSIFSILAVYQEYSAHSELVSDKDPKLSAKWHSLFNWGIISALLISIGSVIAVLVVAMLEMDAARTSGIIVGVVSIPQYVIDVVYLLYLKKMIQLFKCEGEVYDRDA